MKRMNCHNCTFVGESEFEFLVSLTERLDDGSTAQPVFRAMPTNFFAAHGSKDRELCVSVWFVRAPPHCKRYICPGRARKPTVIEEWNSQVSVFSKNGNSVVVVESHVCVRAYGRQNIRTTYRHTDIPIYGYFVSV
jgi:hypothetical protein